MVAEHIKNMYYINNQGEQVQAHSHIEKPTMYLWVWREDDSDYSVFVFAPDEVTAWEILKIYNKGAWNMLRGNIGRRDDGRTLEELDPSLRPRRVEHPEAFVIW